MKRFLKIVVVTVFCLLISVSMLMVSAAENGTVIYKNDFSNGVDTTMNYFKYGSYEIVTSFGETFMRCKSATSGTRAFRVNFGPEEAKNVDISFRIRSIGAQSNSAAYYGVYFRSPSIPANAKFSYQLRFNASMTSLACYDAYSDNQQTVLTEEATAGFTDCLWYNVKICLRDTRIVAFVNGKQVIDYTDDFFPALGGFGIMSTRYNFDIDDIVITQYKGKLPTPTPNEAPAWVGAPSSSYKVDIPDSGKERLNLSGIGGSNKLDEVISDGLAGNVWIAVILISLIILLSIGILIISIKLSKLIRTNKANVLGNETIDINDAQNIE